MTGSSLRRQLVLAEFIAGLAVALALGCWLLAAAPSIAGRVVGALVLGAGLNYAPLSAYAIALSRPGRLDAELAEVDITSELRRYTKMQLLIFVPLTLVISTMIAGRRPVRLEGK